MQQSFDDFLISLKRVSREIIEQSLKDLLRDNAKTRKDAWEWFNDSNDKAFSYRFCLTYSELNPNGLKGFFREYDSFMKLYFRDEDRGLKQLTVLKKRYNEPKKNKKIKAKD